MSIINEGWFNDIENEQYHKGPGVSSTGLRVLAKSPGHYKAYLDEGFPETEALLESQAFHTYLLEPEEYSKKYNVISGVRSKKMKEEAAEEGIKLITDKQMKNITNWYDAIAEHEDAFKLIASRGNIERSGYWIDGESNVLCKIRPDKLIPGIRTIVDLKTMSTAQRDEVNLEINFNRAIANYKYHWQAAYYLMGTSVLEKTEYINFIWIVVEKEAPHQVCVKIADESMLYEGEHNIKMLIHRYGECSHAGVWPKPLYPGIRVASLPEWYYQREVIYG